MFLSGLLGGVLTGLGMGGGTVTIPLLVLGFQVSQFSAILINLLAFLPAGLSALIIHTKNGLVQFGYVLIILVPALVTAGIVSWFSLSLDVSVLKRLFGVFLVIVAMVSLGLKSVKKN